MRHDALRMHASAAVACLALMGALTGCTSSVPEAGARTLVIGGMAVIVVPLTAGTWTARTQEPNKTLPQNADSTTQLRRAIEAASGCRVTDSNYAEGGRQFDAQLDCKAGNR